jgi:hypothetical protein
MQKTETNKGIYMSTLADILKNPYFLKDREELFNYQLFYEIKKIGLQNNVDFEMLEPIIDKNGYDLLIKYRNSTKALQLKCAERNGTSCWEINKLFLKPLTLLEARTILPDGNASHIGLGGGVILIEYFIDPTNKVEIKYFYTDFVCISFFLRKYRQWTLQKSFPEFIQSIFDDRNSERKFTLPKSLFFEVTIEQMLYLSRVLPTTNSLKKTDTWFFNYPRIDEITDCDKPIEEKDIEILLDNGSYNSWKLKVYNLFNCTHNHNEININDKMKI